LGSIAELEKLSQKSIGDIHKHFVDPIEIPCPSCRKPMKRIPEVLDCWFESGAMPYGQAHYPFENKDKFEKSFPADFIAEGLDQTRGWFYTLTVLGNALFKKSPFKNVIVNGLVLAEDGKKMSKRLKNYPDPVFILDNIGADALRAYLMCSPATRAEELRFSENGVRGIVRSVLLPYWNAASFFLTYALADHWDPESFNLNGVGKTAHQLDRWILSRLQTLIKRVDDKMALYHVYEVVPEVLRFIDSLTNWYIRLNRRRFWEEGRSADKGAAYQTLYFVLLEFTKILAPILPFVSEEVFQSLKREDSGESVHLCRFPKLQPEWINEELETEMELIEKIVSMGRLSRNNHRLKTRQPLRELLVITQDPKDKKTIERFKGLIQTELNVKKVSFSSEESKWVSFSAKPNAKILGPRLGAKMKDVS
jgi:isoleucyl-tRNA synthetase